MVRDISLPSFRKDPGVKTQMFDITTWRGKGLNGGFFTNWGGVETANALMMKQPISSKGHVGKLDGESVYDAPRTAKELTPKPPTSLLPGEVGKEVKKGLLVEDAPYDWLRVI